jgi:hypothetical protein
VSQIQKFIISVASPLILFRDFYDKNFLRAAVFIDKGRIVAYRCARFDLILLNADTDNSVLTAWNLIYTQPSFLHSTFKCLQFLIYVTVTAMLKYLHYYTTYNHILASQMDHQKS